MNSIAEGSSDQPKQFITELPNLSNEQNTPLALAKAALLKVLQNAFKRNQRRESVNTNQDEDECQSMLHTQINSFFDRELALAIQSRETEYVNTMSGVFREEVQSLQAVVRNRDKEIKELQQRIIDDEEQIDVLVSKLDRRKEDSNQRRKIHYKEMLMLREMVTNKKTDPRTLRALDEAMFGNISLSNSEHLAETFDNNSSTQSGMKKRQSICRILDNELINELECSSQKIKSLVLELENQREIVNGLKNDRDKWREKNTETNSQCDALRKELFERRDEKRSWWNGGCIGGIEEHSEILSAIDTGKTSWANVASSLLEIVSDENFCDILIEKIENRAEFGNSVGFQKIVDYFERETSQKEDSPVHVVEDKPVRNEGPNTKGTVSQCAGCIALASLKNDEESSSDTHLKKALSRVLELKTEILTYKSTIEKLECDLQESDSSVNTLTAELMVCKRNITETHELSTQTEFHLEDAVMNLGRRHNEREMNVKRNESKDIGKEIELIKKFEQCAAQSQLYQSLLEEKDKALKDLVNDFNSKNEAIKTMQNFIESHNTQVEKIIEASGAKETILYDEVKVLRNKIAEMQDWRVSKLEKRKEAVKHQIAKLFSPKFPIEKGGNIENNVSDDEGSDSENEESIYSEDVKEAERSYLDYSKSAAQAVTDYENIRSGIKTEQTDCLSGQSGDGSQNAETFQEMLSRIQKTLKWERDEKWKIKELLSGRIVTLTSNLAHMSDEMLLFRKRSEAQINFWKLECEKLEFEKEGMDEEFKQYRNDYGITQHTRKTSTISAEIEEYARFTNEATERFLVVKDVQKEEEIRQLTIENIIERLSIFFSEIIDKNDDVKIKEAQRFMAFLQHVLIIEKEGNGLETDDVAIKPKKYSKKALLNLARSQSAFLAANSPDKVKGSKVEGRPKLTTGLSKSISKALSLKKGIKKKKKNDELPTSLLSEYNSSELSTTTIKDSNINYDNCGEICQNIVATTDGGGGTLATEDFINQHLEPHEGVLQPHTVQESSQENFLSAKGNENSACQDNITQIIQQQSTVTEGSLNQIVEQPTCIEDINQIVGEPSCASDRNQVDMQASLTNDSINKAVEQPSCTDNIDDQPNCEKGNFNQIADQPNCTKVDTKQIADQLKCTKDNIKPIVEQSRLVNDSNNGFVEQSCCSDGFDEVGNSKENQIRLGNSQSKDILPQEVFHCRDPDTEDEDNNSYEVLRPLSSSSQLNININKQKGSVGKLAIVNITTAYRSSEERNSVSQARTSGLLSMKSASISDEKNFAYRQFQRYSQTNFDNSQLKSTKEREACVALEASSVPDQLSINGDFKMLSQNSLLDMERNLGHRVLESSSGFDYEQDGNEVVLRRSTAQTQSFNNIRQLTLYRLNNQGCLAALNWKLMALQLKYIRAIKRYNFMASEACRFSNKGPECNTSNNIQNMCDVEKALIKKLKFNVSEVKNEKLVMCKNATSNVKNILNELNKMLFGEEDPMTNEQISWNEKRMQQPIRHTKVDFGSLPFSQQIPTLHFPAIRKLLKSKHFNNSPNENSPYKENERLPIRKLTFAGDAGHKPHSFQHVLRDPVKKNSSKLTEGNLDYKKSLQIKSFQGSKTADGDHNGSLNEHRILLQKPSNIDNFSSITPCRPKSSSLYSSNRKFSSKVQELEVRNKKNECDYIQKDEGAVRSSSQAFLNL